MSHDNKSRNPYLSDDGRPILRPSVVVFLDVLGYQDLVNEAAKQGEAQQFLEHLHKTLTEAVRLLNAENETMRGFSVFEKDMYRVKTFTDNIVIGYPLLPTGPDARHDLTGIIMALSLFQTVMATEGLFVRGGISIGNLYMDKTVVYGQGLMEAHKGEEELARDPRLVLTRSAREVAQRHPNDYVDPREHTIYQDSDSQYFLNYLEYSILIAENEVGPNYELLVKHKSAIEKELARYQNQPTTWSKFAWAAQYHNFFCEQHPYFAEEHKIDLAKYQMQPRLIINDEIER